MPTDASTPLTVGKSRPVSVQAFDKLGAPLPGLTYAYQVVGSCFTYANGSITGVFAGTGTLRASVVGDPLAPTADLTVTVTVPTSPVNLLQWTVGAEV